MSAAGIFIVVSHQFKIVSVRVGRFISSIGVLESYCLKRKYRGKVHSHPLRCAQFYSRPSAKIGQYSIDVDTNGVFQEQYVFYLPWLISSLKDFGALGEYLRPFSSA
jgi:hypothetical protein